MTDPRTTAIRPTEATVTAARPRAAATTSHTVSNDQKIDYVELVDPRTMDPIELIEGEVLLLVAAAFGETRLLDNATITPPEDR